MSKLAALAVLLAGVAQHTVPTSEQRLAQAQRFARHAGDRLWRGYGAAPFEALLIEPTREILLCRTRLPAGFTPVGHDPATGCARATRPRSDLSAESLAAMPVFDLPATIVMGTPKTTGLTPAQWTRTILHEHFHQWQMSLPDYYPRTKALGLAGADGSAMWMLNFSFPYADPTVAAAYARASTTLADAVAARGTAGFAPALRQYLAARDKFAAAAGARNWRYFDFELWQEGIARWTELTLGRVYPDPAVRADSTAAEARILASLRKPDLAKLGRGAAYNLGTGEGMVLEACDPSWRKHYSGELALTPLFDAARRGCALQPRP